MIRAFQHSGIPAFRIIPGTGGNSSYLKTAQRPAHNLVLVLVVDSSY